jgi:hypothetical protein
MATATKKTLLISIAGYDREETLKAMELAKRATIDFDVLVMSYGGAYEHLLEEQGLDVLRVNPPGR